MRGDTNPLPHTPSSCST